MSVFLIGKDITDVPTISKQSFVFNPFYSEERVDVLYHQHLLSTIKNEVKASYNVLHKYFQEVIWSLKQFYSEFLIYFYSHLIVNNMIL